MRCFVSISMLCLVCIEKLGFVRLYAISVVLPVCVIVVVGVYRLVRVVVRVVRLVVVEIRVCVIVTWATRSMVVASVSSRISTDISIIAVVL